MLRHVSPISVNLRQKGIVALRRRVSVPGPTCISANKNAACPNVSVRSKMKKDLLGFNQLPIEDLRILSMYKFSGHSFGSGEAIPSGSQFTLGIHQIFPRCEDFLPCLRILKCFSSCSEPALSRANVWLRFWFFLCGPSRPLHYCPSNSSRAAKIFLVAKFDPTNPIRFSLRPSAFSAISAVVILS